jgi:hypothetical protein
MGAALLGRRPHHLQRFRRECAGWPWDKMASLPLSTFWQDVTALRRGVSRWLLQSIRDTTALRRDDTAFRN